MSTDFLKKLVFIVAGVALGHALLTGRLLPGSGPKELPALDLQFLSARPAMEGRPVLLEFWATWCGPCRQMIPHLNEIADRNRSRGLVVIGVSNEDESVVRPFMASSGQRYTIALDPGGKLFRDFQVRGIPHAVLADKTGRVVWSGHPARLTDEIIATAL